jgi:LPS-assembly protein
MAFFACIILCFLSCCQAQETEPILIQADEMTYKQQEEILLIQGNVKISKKDSQTQNWRTLLADEVRYHQKEKTLYATGNVRIQEPTGDVIHVQKGQISEDFQNGLLDGLYILTQDEARFASQKGKKISGTTQLQQATYSPCALCKANVMEAPLWQVRAEEINHDQNSKTVSYKNARLEMKGIPVFYFPYFSHPDPTVKRKSGLLPPMFKVSKDLGFVVAQPVYYEIAPNRDLTITPMFSEKQNPVMVAGYGHRFLNGELKTTASYTKTHGIKKLAYGEWNGPRPPHPNRWHFSTLAQYHMSDDKRLLIDVNRASDTTYLSRYPIRNQMPAFFQNRNLTSTLTFERFGVNRYFSTTAYAFQTDTPKTTPAVAPKAYYHQQMQPEKFGGVFTLEGGILSLSRQMSVPGRLGTQLQRGTLGAYWKKPWFFNSGHILTLKTSLRTDAYYTRRYYVSDMPAPKSLQHTERTTGRIFPQGALEWKYPLIKHLNQANWILEPKAMVTASPQKLNNLHIPNEDSNTFELDDTTLFLMNRFHGVDRVDVGQRAVYGVDNTIQLPKQRSFSVFLGQSRRLDHRQAILKNLGEDQNQSDYIARIKIRPASWFSTRYRTALQPSKKMRQRYSEWGAVFGKKRLQLDVGFMYLDKTANLRNENVSQVNWQLKSQLTEIWSFSFAQIRNLNRQKNRASLANFLQATYHDECFKMDLGIYKTETQDRDIRPDSGFLVQLSFKNLGGFAPATAPMYPGSVLTHLGQ